MQEFCFLMMCTLSRRIHFPRLVEPFSFMISSSQADELFAVSMHRLIEDSDGYSIFPEVSMSLKVKEDNREQGHNP
jgi:hypothetical protein